MPYILPAFCNARSDDTARTPHAGDDVSTVPSLLRAAARCCRLQSALSTPKRILRTYRRYAQTSTPPPHLIQLTPFNRQPPPNPCHSIASISYASCILCREYQAYQVVSCRMRNSEAGSAHQYLLKMPGDKELLPESQSCWNRLALAL